MRWFHWFKGQRKIRMAMRVSVALMSMFTLMAVAPASLANPIPLYLNQDLSKKIAKTVVEMLGKRTASAQGRNGACHKHEPLPRLTLEEPTCTRFEDGSLGVEVEREPGNTRTN